MSVKEQQTGAWAPEWVQETEPDYTPRPRRSRKPRRPRWPGIALALECLEQYAGERQILLFTCHGRERAWQAGRGLKKAPIP